MAHMTLRAVLGAVVLGVAVVACGSAATATRLPASLATVPTAAPTATPSPAPVPTPVSTTVRTPDPTPVPTTVPTPAPTPSAAACVVEPQTGLLPSDRMTNVEILGVPGRDIVRFGFGERSLDGIGPATGTLEVASPPFTGGASGLPIDLHGEHALQVVFKRMSLQNDVGQPTYDGPREFEVTDASRSLRHLVLFDESEGQIGWYVGYDGPGCITLTREGDSIVLAIE
jgi:hypothetical protein